MSKFGMSVMAGMLILLAAGSAFGEESGILREEMDEMKIKLERLEKAIEQQAAPTSKKEDESQWFNKIDIAVGATAVLQGSTGAKERLSTEGDVTHGSMSLDLELTMPIMENGKACALFETGNGDGIDGDIPTLSGFNDDADNEESLRVSELWYEHRLLSQKLTLKIGKIDLNAPSGWHETAFDGNAVANDEQSQFLSSGFVNNLAVEFPDDNGFGAELWVSPHDLWDIGIGAADADADWNNVFEDLFSIVQLDFKPRIAERQGNYRIYGWFNGKDHEDLRDAAKTKEKNCGVGLSFDQELTDLVTLFARYGRQRGRVSQVKHGRSAGIQCSGKFYGREIDTFGLAYGVAIIGEDWRAVDRSDGIKSGDEHHVELYYNLKVNDHLDISPDIQWVKNPNGDRDNDMVWAFGIRAQLSF